MINASALVAVTGFDGARGFCFERVRPLFYVARKVWIGDALLDRRQVDGPLHAPASNAPSELTTAAIIRAEAKRVFICLFMLPTLAGTSFQHAVHVHWVCGWFALTYGR